MNVWTLGASPVTGQEKKRRIIRPTILNFLTCNFSCAGDFQVRPFFSYININDHINLRNETAMEGYKIFLNF